jgi:hypothetical protein
VLNNSHMDFTVYKANFEDKTNIPDLLPLTVQPSSPVLYLQNGSSLTGLQKELSNYDTYLPTWSTQMVEVFEKWLSVTRFPPKLTE